MSTTDLIERLLVLPGAIAGAEEAVLEAEGLHRRAERSLQRCQDGLLLDGESVTGRNAEVRAAQLRCQTAGPEAGVEAAAAVLAQRRITVRLLQHQHASLRAIARLMGGEL